MKISNLSVFVVNMVGKFFRKVFRNLDYSLGRLESLYRYNSNIKPFNVYYVDPKNIEEFVKKNFIEFKYFNLSPIMKGDWDIDTHELDESEIFSSFEQHFQQQVPWEKTDLYLNEVSYLQKQKEWDGREFSNKEEIKSYLHDKDELFKKIKNEGYRTQKELASENNTSFWVPSSKAPERNEITVHIGRDGKIILEDGFHRLAIAKILELDKIPVRIAARHSEWQEKREKLINAEETGEDIDHPDLVDLVEDKGK